MVLELQVDTSDKQVAFDLFGSPKSLGEGALAPAPGGATLELRQWYFREAFGAYDTLTIIVDFARDVGVALFASWLYDKLKGGRTQTLRINRVDVQIDEGSILTVIAKQIVKGEE